MSVIAHDLAALPKRIAHPALHWADTTPDAPALATAERGLTYRELRSAIGEARRLLGEMGVRSGDRVMIVGENGIAMVVLIFAISELDAWSVIVNGRLSGRELAAIETHCRPRRILYTVDDSADAETHAAQSGARPLRIGAVASAAAGALAPCDAEPTHAGGERQVAALIYTSGTTGDPRGVMLTHRNLLYIASVSGKQRGLCAGDRVYGVLPIAHVFGLASTFLGTIYAGGCLETVPRFDPALVVAALQRGITVLQGVPVMYARLLEYAEIHGARLAGPRLRYLSAGGAPLDLGLKQRVERAFGLPLNNGYGLTECSPTVAQTRMDAPRDDESVGPPLPGLETRIVDEDGRDVETGAVGELWVRGPNVMAGYYRDADATAAAITADGWLRSGDLARRDPVDPDGSLFIVGRRKELIVHSGFNVYPAEVEGVLSLHPEVTVAAVVGKSAASNEDVFAFVQVVPGSAVSEADLKQFAAKRLAPYKVPGRIVRLESLPASSTGKILKKELVKQARGMEPESIP